MTFREIADALGVENYPEVLDTYYPIPEERKGELCTLSLIDELQEEFNLFGTFYDAVREGFLDLKNDPVRHAFMDAASLFIKDQPAPAVRKLKCPKGGFSPASNMMPLFVHLPSARGTYEELRRRGFSDEEARSTLEYYRIYLWEVKAFRAGYDGITPAISNWMTFFTKCEIFYPGKGGLNFQIQHTDIATTPYILKNRATSALLAVFGGGTFHKSGVTLGSAGAEDEEGAFTATWEETDDAYIGHPTREYVVSSEKEVFLKSEWELAFCPGADVLSTHIFFQSDFTPQVVESAFEDAKLLAKKCYPEFDFKAIFCCSWLLSPVLNRVLGEEAKISGFSSRFTRFPAKSAAKAVMQYVFPGKYETLEKLPENTRLQRALKKELMAGTFIYDTAGIIPF